MQVWEMVEKERGKKKRTGGELRRGQKEKGPGDVSLLFRPRDFQVVGKGEGEMGTGPGGFGTTEGIPEKKEIEAVNHWEGTRKRVKAIQRKWDERRKKFPR